MDSRTWSSIERVINKIEDDEKRKEYLDSEIKKDIENSEKGHVSIYAHFYDDTNTDILEEELASLKKEGYHVRKHTTYDIYNEKGKRLLRAHQYRYLAKMIEMCGPEEFDELFVRKEINHE